MLLVFFSESKTRQNSNSALPKAQNVSVRKNDNEKEADFGKVFQNCMILS